MIKQIIDSYKNKNFPEPFINKLNKRLSDSEKEKYNQDWLDVFLKVSYDKNMSFSQQDHK